MPEMTKKAYGTTFVECTRLHIHANCRLRRVYFADRAYPDEELPKEYKLFLRDGSVESLNSASIQQSRGNSPSPMTPSPSKRTSN